MMLTRSMTPRTGIEAMTDHSDLIAELRALADCDSRAGEPLGKCMRRAASALSSQSLSLSEARAALNSFQDEVWGSFDGWAKSLGWGLTGIQPECFAMMDASVRELVEARKQLDAISAAIGSTRFMDPPDGGDVSLAEQVRRMREALGEAETALKPFAQAAIDCDVADDLRIGVVKREQDIWESPVAASITFGHIADARSALENAPAPLADAHTKGSRS